MTRGRLSLLAEKDNAHDARLAALGRIELDIEGAEGRAARGLTEGGGRAREGAEEKDVVQGGHCAAVTSGYSVPISTLPNPAITACLP